MHLYVRSIVAVSLAIPFLIGCNESKKLKELEQESPNNHVAAAPASPKISPTFFVGKDVERLRWPEGFSRFATKNNNGFVKPEHYSEVLERVREFESMDQNKSIHGYIIPELKWLCALSLANQGKLDESLELLEELERKGYLPARELKNESCFESVRDTERFQKLIKSAEEKSDASSIGPYLVVDEPFCKLDELLVPRTRPELPDSGEFEGKVTVVFTGSKILKTKMERAPGIETAALQKAHAAGARVVAIVGELPKKKVAEVEYFLAEVEDKKSLNTDGSRIYWIANHAGEVVYVQRTDGYTDGSEIATVVEYLNENDRQ